MNTANWHQWWWGTHNVKCKDVTMQQTHQIEWIGFNGGGGPQLKCKKVTTQQISFSGDGDSQLKCNKVTMQWTQWIGINSERSECSKFASLVVGTQNVSTKKSTHIKFQPCSKFGHAVNVANAMRVKIPAWDLFLFKHWWGCPPSPPPFAVYVTNPRSETPSHLCVFLTQHDIVFSHWLDG